MPTTTLPSGLYSLLKIALLTFFGAFLGALTLSGPIPTTVDGWKTLLLPALGVAIAAEVYFLRSTIKTVLAQLVAAQGGAPAPELPPPSPAATTPTVTASKTP